MSGKYTIFDDKKINKSNFYKNKKLIQIDNVDVNKILTSKRESYGKKKSFKYFIGYIDNDDIKPLNIKLSQMIGYAKYYFSNKTISCKVNDEKLFKKHTRTW